MVIDVEMILRARCSLSEHYGGGTRAPVVRRNPNFAQTRAGFTITMCEEKNPEIFTAEIMIAKYGDFVPSKKARQVITPTEPSFRSHHMGGISVRTFLYRVRGSGSTKILSVAGSAESKQTQHGRKNPNSVHQQNQSARRA